MCDFAFSSIPFFFLRDSLFTFRAFHSPAVSASRCREENTFACPRRRSSWTGGYSRTLTGPEDWSRASTSRQGGQGEIETHVREQELCRMD